MRFVSSKNLICQKGAAILELVIVLVLLVIVSYVAFKPLIVKLIADDGDDPAAAIMSAYQAVNFGSDQSWVNIGFSGMFRSERRNEVKNKLSIVVNELEKLTSRTTFCAFAIRQDTPMGPPILRTSADAAAMPCLAALPIQIEQAYAAAGDLENVVNAVGVIDLPTGLFKIEAVQPGTDTNFSTTSVDDPL